MKGFAALRLELLGAVPTDHPVRLAALAEAASDEHPYGPWKGGKASSGGHLMSASEQKAAKANEKKPDPNDKNLVLYNGRLTHRSHLEAGGIKAPPYDGKNVPVLNTSLKQTKAPTLKPKRTRKPKSPWGPEAADSWTKRNPAARGRVDTWTLPKKPTLTGVKAQMVRGQPELKGITDFKAEWTKPPKLERDREGRLTYYGTVRFSATGVRTKEMIVQVDASGDAHPVNVEEARARLELLGGPAVPYNHPARQALWRAMHEAGLPFGEASGDEHFYGAWKGGSKASGGGPMTQTERAEARAPSGAKQALAAHERVAPLRPSMYMHNDERTFDRVADSVISGHAITQRRGGITVQRGYRPKPDSIVEMPRQYLPSNERLFVLTGANGRPEGLVGIDVRAKSIDAVMVRPDARGRGVATRMYDRLQDSGTVNFYPLMGNSSYTVAGRAFSQKWLEHRVRVEAQRAGIQEADRRPEKSRLEQAKAALERVKRAKISPDGERSPEEGPRTIEKRMAEAEADLVRVLGEAASDDHFYGAWKGGKASEGGHPAGGGGLRSPEPLVLSTKGWEQGAKSPEQVAATIARGEKGFRADGGKTSRIDTQEDHEKAIEDFRDTRSTITSRMNSDDAHAWRTSDGPTFTQHAILNAPFYASGFDPGVQVHVARTRDGGVAGAMLLANAGINKLLPGTQANAPLHIDLLGTTGITPGAGSTLASIAIREAAANGQGMRLNAISTAVPFWEKMGFVAGGLHPSLTPMSMSPERVQEIASGL